MADDRARFDKKTGVAALMAVDTNGELQRVLVDTDGKLQTIATTTAGDTTGTPTHTADVTVDNTAGGVTLLASNAARKSAVIQNTGANNIRVSVGGTPTASNGIQLSAGQVLTLELPYIATGAIKAIREGGSNSTAAVLEIA